MTGRPTYYLEGAAADPPQGALREDVDWVHQPAFDKAYADLTGEPCEHDEWRREVNWNFTADDQSFT